MATDNFRKHTATNPLQRFLIERFHGALLAEARALSPERVLDVGCGEGFTLERLRHAQIGSTLEGVDVNREALMLGERVHPHLALREGSAYELPYADGSFDLVICSEVLEHLERPEDALQEICRVSSKHALISVPHEPWFQLANLARGKNLARWGNDIEHIQHWSARGIAGLVSTRFAVRAVRTPFPWTLVIAEKRV